MDDVYFPRLFDDELKFCLESVGAVLIVGPKFCGKSTTSSRCAKTVIDLTDEKSQRQYISLALNAPEEFLNQGEKPMLIDEWQVISFIWNSIKEDAFKSRKFGQYILNGSVTDYTKREGRYGQTHAGTGRILTKMLRTFSPSLATSTNISLSHPL